MRTRIALVVAVPVAVITISSFTQTASAQSAPTTTATHTAPTTASRHSGGVVPGLLFDSDAAVLVPRASPINMLTPRHRQTVRRSTAHTLKSTPVPATAVKPVPATAVKPVSTTVSTAATTPTTAASSLATTPVVALGTTATTSAPAPTVAPSPVSTTPTTSGPVDTVTPDQRAEWEQVAMCEEGGNWQYDGGSYSGGLGINRANWDAYGGLEFAPEGAAATEDQQIMVAERIQFDPPDRDGCSGW
jgi:Transglycosylase-like domain